MKKLIKLLITIIVAVVIIPVGLALSILLIPAALIFRNKDIALAPIALAIALVFHNDFDKWLVSKKGHYLTDDEDFEQKPAKRKRGRPRKKR